MKKIDLIKLLLENTEPFRIIDFSKKNWEKEFPDNFVNTPIGRVKMGENQYEKLEANGRVYLMGVIKSILENPTLIYKTPTNTKNFVKSFNFENRVKTFLSVTIKRDDLNICISNQEKDINNLINRASENEIVYQKNASKGVIITKAEPCQLTGKHNAECTPEHLYSSGNLDTLSHKNFEMSSLKTSKNFDFKKQNKNKGGFER